MNWTGFVMVGSIFGATGVAMGAFGSHLLKSKISASSLDVYKTAISYHLFHALAILLCGVLAARIDSSLLKGAGFSFIVGILLFSGSLYFMTITGNKSLGIITPIGGIALITGWILITASVFKLNIGS